MPEIPAEDREPRHQPSSWEYTESTCDVWQIHHLCNHFAEFGWEFVAVVESHPGVKVPSRVGDENGSHYEALRPYTVLFRRPA